MSKEILNYLKKLDYNISYTIYSNGCQRMPSNTRSYLKALEYSCHGIPWFAITIILLYLSPNNKTFAQLLVGLFLDIIFVAVIKAWSRRRRPLYAKQDDQLIVVSIDKHSFPSGHASRAIYVALFCSNHSLISLLIWLWSICVCASRLLLGRHHLGDILFGAFLGYFNFIAQFTIFSPINAILLWGVSTIFNVTFSNVNDFD